MNIFTVRQFLRYTCFSRHWKGHGIHSPFIFNVVSKVFWNKTRPDVVNNIEKIRKTLLANRVVVEVNDLGAGSRKMKTRSRKVSDIARYSSVPKKYGVLLANLAESFGGDMVLELGTSLGISAMYLASSVPDTPVLTLEGCESTAAVAEESFRKGGFKNIRLMNGSFDELLPVIAKERIQPGLTFIDGDHRKAPLISYFERIVEMSGKNSVVIIDDIYSSREMAEAWIQVKKHPAVSSTIDVFRMGLVFFREGLTRSDYVVRY